MMCAVTATESNAAQVEARSSTRQLLATQAERLKMLMAQYGSDSAGNLEAAATANARTAP